MFRADRLATLYLFRPLRQHTGWRGCPRVPILHNYGFRATVFLPTACIADDRRSLNSRDCLTWREVRELHRLGVVFGSHTVTHRQLKVLTPETVEQEIRDSKVTLEHHLGHP